MVQQSPSPASTTGQGPESSAARLSGGPVLERAAHDIALPAPRPPVLEPGAHDIPRSVLEPAALEKAQPEQRPVRQPRAGWILSTVVAAAAAWAVGWIAGVSWAWHAMTPRYLPHRRLVGGLPASFGPGK
jgi:hypothetical protein